MTPRAPLTIRPDPVRRPVEFADRAETGGIAQAVGAPTDTYGVTMTLLRPQIPGVVPPHDPVMATPEYAAALAEYSRLLPVDQATGAALKAARQAVRPDVYAVVACTLAFGLLGAVCAARRAGRANALALPVSRYWVAYLATLATWVLVFFLIAAAVAGR